MATATGGHVRLIPTIPTTRSMLGSIRMNLTLATTTIIARTGTQFADS